MPKFLLIARDTGEYPEMSPDQIQHLFQRYHDWTAGLAAAGHLHGGEKLKDGEGRVVQKGGGVTDGPYVESKEVLGGFWLLEAADYDEALRLVADSPHLEFGTLELRQIEVLVGAPA